MNASRHVYLVKVWCVFDMCRQLTCTGSWHHRPSEESKHILSILPLKGDTARWSSGLGRDSWVVSALSNHKRSCCKHLCKSLQMDICFHFSRSIPSRGAPGSCRRCRFSSSRNRHVVFQRGSTVLYSWEQCMRVPVPEFEVTMERPGCHFLDPGTRLNVSKTGTRHSTLRVWCRMKDTITCEILPNTRAQISVWRPFTGSMKARGRS